MTTRKSLQDFICTKAQHEQLSDYSKLLLQWNNKINLIGRSTSAEIWQRHILDCTALQTHISASDLHIADLGSGAGLPGVILAIMSENPITLIESSEKKVAFLQEVKNQLGLQYTIAHCRIESFAPEKKFDIITARAVAQLNTLWSWSHGIREKSAIGLFLKGVQVEQEFASLDSNIHIKTMSHPYGEGKIIILQNTEENQKGS